MLDTCMQVELPGCTGIWTVYHKNARGQLAADDNEYHAYLIISLEARTMVNPFTFHPKQKLNFFAKYILHMSELHV